MKGDGYSTGGFVTTLQPYPPFYPMRHQKAYIAEAYLGSAKSPRRSLTALSRRRREPQLRISRGTFRHDYKVLRSYGSIEYQRKYLAIERTTRKIGAEGDTAVHQTDREQPTSTRDVSAQTNVTLMST